MFVPFTGVSGVFGVTVITAIHACVTENHGNGQSKGRGRWYGHQYRPYPPQEKGALVYQEDQMFA